MNIQRIGEVCLLTQDVPRLADFYRRLLGVLPGEDGENWGHQFVLARETSLAILRDDHPRRGQSAVLVFTVADMDQACRRVRDMGAELVEPPTPRPWGVVSMCVRDPDGNRVYLRCFAGQQA